MAEMEVSDGDERVTLVRLESRDEDEDDADEVGDAPPSPPRDPPSPREVGTRSGAAAASPAARVAVLVPFREDGTGRAAQPLAPGAPRDALPRPRPVRGGRGGAVRGRPQVQPRSAPERRLRAPSRLPSRVDLRRHPLLLPRLRHAPRPVPGAPLPPTETLLPESERTPLGPFVRVLTAAGSRYDHDACFGGVTLYDAPGFLATNGYPNGFWGWGSEDNAQFLRCARARLWLERVHRCAFDDLEGLDTVEEKLAALDVAGARCAAKDKR